MKYLNVKIMALILSLFTVLVLSGCGSSGTSSNHELVGGEPVVAPVVAAPYEITAHHDSTVVVHSHVTPSPTSDEHTHAWTQVSGPTVALTTPTAQTTTFVLPTTAKQQPVVLQHTVTNKQTGQTTVKHHKINPIPKTKPVSLVVSTHDESVWSGSKASLHASASGGDGKYTYTWTQTGGTTVTLNETHPSAPTFTAPSVTQTEDLIFEVLVRDGQGNTASGTEIITVVPPLAVTASVPEKMHGNHWVVLSAHATGGIAPYTYQWTYKPTGGSIRNPTSADASFAPGVVDNVQWFRFEVTVTDAQGHSVTAFDDLIAIR